MAAVIIQHYKVRGGQLPLQPEKRDLGVGGVGVKEVGFGAAARTGYLELMGLKAITRRTGGSSAVEFMLMYGKLRI